MLPSFFNLRRHMRKIEAFCIGYLPSLLRPSITFEDATIAYQTYQLYTSTVLISFILLEKNYWNQWNATDEDGDSYVNYRSL